MGALAFFTFSFPLPLHPQRVVVALKVILGVGHRDLGLLLEGKDKCRLLLFLLFLEDAGGHVQNRALASGSVGNAGTDPVNRCF